MSHFFFLKDLPYPIVKRCRNISSEAHAASLGQRGLLETWAGGMGFGFSSTWRTEGWLGPGSAFG